MFNAVSYSQRQVLTSDMTQVQSGILQWKRLSLTCTSYSLFFVDYNLLYVVVESQRDLNSLH